MLGHCLSDNIEAGLLPWKLLSRCNDECGVKAGTLGHSPIIFGHDLGNCDELGLGCGELSGACY